MTRYVDVTVLVTDDSLENFVDAVLERFRPRISDARSFALRHRVLLVETGKGIPIDISLGIPGYEEGVLKRAVALKFPPVGTLRVISAEDLIIHKCVAGRARDLEDVEGILIRQRFRVNFELIRGWLSAFQRVMEEHDPLRAFEAALEQARKRLSRSRPP